MSKRIFVYITLIIILSLQAGLGTAQSTRIAEENTRYIDSVEAAFLISPCDNILTYPGIYKKNKVKRDISLMIFLNTVFNDNNTVLELLQEAQKIKKVRIGSDTKQIGLIRVDEIIFNTDHERIELLLESMDSLIYRKRMRITTNMPTRCGEAMYHVLDFQWIKQTLLKTIQFPVTVFNNFWLTAESFNPAIIDRVATQHTGYVFKVNAPGETKWINTLYANQFNKDSACCYLFDRVRDPWKALVKNEKWEVLKDFLYSPNYYFAINAMEALIYGQSQNKITIDDQDIRKIEAIKRAGFEFQARTAPDVFPRYDGYKELNMTDKRVIGKYKLVMQ